MATETEFHAAIERDFGYSAERRGTAAVGGSRSQRQSPTRLPRRKAEVYPFRKAWWLAVLGVVAPARPTRSWPGSSGGGNDDPRSSSRSRAQFTTPAAGRWSSAAAFATSCSAARRRTTTSRSSASTRRRLRGLLEPFGRVDTVGESFTVYKVAGLDVSLPRRESKTGRGHKGFAVEGDPHLSIEDAARRRDFTINAIARDPLTGAILDPFDGRADLQARRLRVVDARTFGDDSLRVLRALQFAARFDLDRRRRHQGAAAGDRARRSSRRTHLGRGRETSAPGAAAVDRPRPRARTGRRRQALARIAAAGRLSAGTRMASRGRRLGAHAAGRRSGTCSASPISIAAAPRR